MQNSCVRRSCWCRAQPTAVLTAYEAGESPSCKPCDLSGSCSCRYWRTMAGGTRCAARGSVLCLLWPCLWVPSAACGCVSAQCSSTSSSDCSPADMPAPHHTTAATSTVRTQIWRTPFKPQLVAMLRPSLAKLPPAFQQARSFHVGVHPQDPSLPLLRELRAAAGTEGGLSLGWDAVPPHILSSCMLAGSGPALGCVLT